MRAIVEQKKLIQGLSNQEIINLYNQIQKEREWTPQKSDLLVSIQVELRRRYMSGAYFSNKGQNLTIFTDYRVALIAHHDEVFLVGNEIHTVRNFDRPTAFLKFYFRVGGTKPYEVIFNRIKTNTISLSDYIADTELPIFLNFEHDRTKTVINTSGVKGYVLCKFRYRLDLMGVDYLRAENNGYFTVYTQSKTMILFSDEQFKDLNGQHWWFEFVLDYVNNKYIYN